MKFNIKDWQVRESRAQGLKKFKTAIKSPFASEDEAKDALKESQDVLEDLQEALYAQSDWSVLVVLQGMDTSGKDGLINHVMSGVNPTGCEVTSFKVPSEQELAHDFLWRAHRALPARGKIGVFNRSYYEDIVVPYVHPKQLKKGEDLKDRAHDIVQFEKYLARQKVLIIKLYLHLSRGEQKRRLLARLDDPSKNWKFSEGDVKERKHWKRYQEAYDFCFNRTSHAHAPWHILPADDKPTARWLAAQVINHRMLDLGLKQPKVDSSRKKELKKIRTHIQASE